MKKHLNNGVDVNGKDRVSNYTFSVLCITVVSDDMYSISVYVLYKSFQEISCGELDKLLICQVFLCKILLQKIKNDEGYIIEAYEI